MHRHTILLSINSLDGHTAKRIGTHITPFAYLMADVTADWMHESGMFSAIPMPGELLLADGERMPMMIPLWPETLHQIVTGRSRANER